MLRFDFDWFDLKLICLIEVIVVQQLVHTRTWYGLVDLFTQSSGALQRRVAVAVHPFVTAMIVGRLGVLQRALRLTSLLIGGGGRRAKITAAVGSGLRPPRISCRTVLGGTVPH